MEGVKRLYRSKEDVMLGGVAKGLAKYWGIDVSVVRLGFVLLAFWGGVGLLVYLVLLVVLPQEPLTVADDKYTDVAKAPTSTGNFWPIAMIGLGVILLFNQFIPLSTLLGQVFWPTLLILSGVYLIIKR